MPPVLGQLGTSFWTGHLSFTLLSMFHLKLFLNFLKCDFKPRLPINCFHAAVLAVVSVYWSAAMHLVLRTIGHSPALVRVDPVNHPYCPLPSEVSWYAGLYLVSVASLPHHLQATHLVFRPTRAEPKHFLLVTQPPRRAEGKREREQESRLWKARAEVRHEMNTSRHLFPLSLHAWL